MYGEKPGPKAATPPCDLLVTNVGLLATPMGSAPLGGERQGEVQLQRNVAVAIEGSKITWVGPVGEAPQAGSTIDARGRLCTPGLIDCHTHLVFGGWRQYEMAQKLAGVPYIEILRHGGGILNTVKETRAANNDHLYRKALRLVREMNTHGVTMMEAKSGYGLDIENELKLLWVIRRLNDSDDCPIEIVPTFLGAHALPEEYKDDRAGFIDLVCGKMLPTVAENRLARYCDVFCEVSVFTAEEAREVLTAAKSLGLAAKIHADELEPIGGSMVAAQMNAVSAGHLIATPIHAMEAMAAAGVIGVLLPSASFYLGKPYARAREMLRAGMALAVASDLNPGSAPGCSLQLAMNIACLKYKMTPAECLTAVTLNAAAALGAAGRCGTVEPGKTADLLIWDAPDLDYIFYRFGSNLVSRVIAHGQVLV